MLLPLLLLLLAAGSHGHIVASSVAACPGGDGNGESGPFALELYDGTRCSLDSTDCADRILDGAVLVTGADAVWDLSRSGPLPLAQGANVTVACLSITSINLQPALESLMDPPFLRWEPGPGLARSLTMRDIELRLGCKQLQEWQALLCSIRLPGCAKVDGPRVDIFSWVMGEVALERVSLTCDPALDGSVFQPACLMAIVQSVDDIVKASADLQDPELPLVLSLSGGLNFGDAFWPEEGLRITANVTLAAAQDSTVVLDFGLKTVLFMVDSRSSATAFLSFRGCILVNLPLSYLPLDHPRRPFGILSTGLWPVYRDQVAMGLYNCTLILTGEEFKFWSFWLSILISPIPAVRQLGNWSFATGVELQPSGDDFIHLARYYGRYTTLVDVRYLVSSDMYTTQQRNNILQITGDEQVPPTVVFQVRNGEDFLTAINKAPTSSAAQYGQYVILTANITMPNGTSRVPIVYPTTITTWPQTYAMIDMQRARDAIAATAEVSIRNTILYNLAGGAAGEHYSYLTSGLWAFNISNWRTVAQQRLSFDNAALLVSVEEVRFYLEATIEWNDRGDRDWISSYKVQSYDTANRTWVFFSTLATLRFSAQRINITSSMPGTLDMIPLTLPASPGGLDSAPGQRPGAVNRQEVLLFATLSITLPTALGAIICTFIVLRRRRLSQLCARNAVGSAAGKSEDGYAGQHDAGASDDESNAATPGGGAKRAGRLATTSCCVPLSLPLPLRLRKSKYVNPLFAEPGALEPEVLLTEVLGPAGQGQGHLAARAGAAAAAAATLPEPGTAEPAQLGSGAELEPLSAAGAGPAARVAEAEAGPCMDGDEGRPGTSRGTSVGRGSPAGSGARAWLAPASIAGGTGAAGVAAEQRPCSGGSGASTTGWLPPLESSSGGGDAGVRRRVQAAAAPPQEQGCSDAGSPSGAPAQPEVTPWPDSWQEAGEQPAAAAGRGPAGEPPQLGALLLRQQSGRDASSSALGLLPVARPGPWGAGPGAGVGVGGELGERLREMQRLERLRVEIGDRHLEVHHSLGWGGCGVVYKGTWKGLPVAVKTVLVQGDSRQSRQFMTEAAISASLQHPNIVTTYLYELRPLDEVDRGRGGADIRVHHPAVEPEASEPAAAGAGASGSGGAGSGPGPGGARMSCWKLYIVQEYCELGTLKGAIDQGYFKGTRKGIPNMAFLLSTALDVAAGLAHVHSKGVVHGDVTVSNVLLQAAPGKPQGCVAKVADFGLSVKLDEGRSHHSHTYGGTPHYMAPERARGLLSQRSDMYSLGVCLWELYCGTPPWRRDAPAGHSNRRSSGRYCDDGTAGSMSSGESNAMPSPYELAGATPPVAYGASGSEVFRFPRSCPPEFSGLVTSCLAADPGDRPDAPAVLAALATMQQRYGQ